MLAPSLENSWEASGAFSDKEDVESSPQAYSVGGVMGGLSVIIKTMTRNKQIVAMR